jgi:AraC-like DNA-binding protein
MVNSFKYLTNNAEDQSWGLYLTVAGSARVLPGSDYPPAGHPTGYNFNWQNGRILDEYQINYITEGRGIIETYSGTCEINEGSVILLNPNIWHRYRPEKETGWMEHYVGFKGELADKMISSSECLNESPVIQIGFKDKIINNFHEIFNYVTDERPGYNQICSGLVIQILGQIIATKKNKNFRHTHIEETIQKACLIIRDNPLSNLNIEELAIGLNIDYTLFRKSFRKYTGLSPKQYHTSLRIKQAVYMLSSTELSIKEISYNLDFCSVFYFNKLFKEKTGRTPSEYRKSFRNKD